MTKQNRAAFIAAQCGVPTLLRGSPGIAKTAGINAFGKSVGRKVITLIGSIREPVDFGGWPLPHSETFDGQTLTTVRMAPPLWVAECNESPCILFLDELTCCPPTVQAAMLRILAELVAGDTPLRGDTWIMAACNPPDQAAGGYDIEMPMANRLCHLDWEMDWQSWRQGLVNGLNFPSPQAPIVPDERTSMIREWGSLVAAFSTHRPSLFNNPPKDRSQQSGAWPSPRSWTNGIKVLAGAAAAGADKETMHQLLVGCVGAGPGGEFFTWQRSLDLPDPEKLLKDASKAIKAGKDVVWKRLERPDMVMACLTGVVNRAIEESSSEAWIAAITICDAACDQSLDVALSCAAPLPAHLPANTRIPTKVVKRMAPLLHAAFN